MQNLITVDIGNSSLKVATFAANRLTTVPLPSQVHRLSQATEIADLQPPLDDVAHHWRIGSVQRQLLQDLTDWLTQNRPRDTFHAVCHTDLDLRLDVEVPAAVGIDRLAAAVAANRLRDPDQAALIVDAGTTITFDGLSATGVFLGGSIRPGRQMRLHAMHQGTDGLPLIGTGAEIPPLIGKNTETAMRAGAFWSVVTEIEGTVARLKSMWGDGLNTFLTGGDAEALAAHLNTNARYEPYLVLSGLAIGQR